MNFKIIILLLSLILAGTACIPAMVKKQITPVPPVLEPTNKNVSIDIKVKSNEKALESVVLELNGIYGEPTIEVSAFRTEGGESIVMKKLYYGINEKVFVIVSIVNDRVLLIDTVHSPEKE